MGGARLAGSEAAPRLILARAGVGAAGRVIQRADLTTHRITVEQPTLILVEEGVKRVRWPGGVCMAREGDALAIEAGEVVDVRAAPGPSGHHRALWISWGPEALDGLHNRAAPGGAAAAPVTLHPAIEADFRGSVLRAFEGLGEASALPAAIAANRLKEVLLWLEERGFRFGPPRGQSLARQLRRAVSAEPAADWSMEAVAQRLATSASTLRRRLAEEGLGFRELLHDVRMTHALSLLQNTDAPVLSVALAVGYDSASRFSARFRSRFGFLPSDVRSRAKRDAAKLPPGALAAAE